MSVEMFEQVTDDDKLMAVIKSKPFPPKHEIVIYFTPRSGSSRVSEILFNTKAMGHANELFNPNFMANIAQSVQAKSLREYVEHSRRKLAVQGVFSFETTSFHIRKIFPDQRVFFDQFAGAMSFWLIREDIVAQAVSLSKMVSTMVSHSATSTDEQRANADSAYQYDSKEIRKRLIQIMVAEHWSERSFAKFNIRPTRISYEYLSTLDANAVIDVFRGDIDVPKVDVAGQPLRHIKIATPKNERFAERFRAENKWFLRLVALKRRKMLSKLQRTP